MYSRKCHRLLHLKSTLQPFGVPRVVTVYYRLWGAVTYVMVSKGPRCRTGGQGARVPAQSSAQSRPALLPPSRRCERQEMEAKCLRRPSI